VLNRRCEPGASSREISGFGGDAAAADPPVIESSRFSFAHRCLSGGSLPWDWRAPVTCQRTGANGLGDQATGGGNGTGPVRLRTRGARIHMAAGLLQFRTRWCGKWDARRVGRDSNWLAPDGSGGFRPGAGRELHVIVWGRGREPRQRCRTYGPERREQVDLLADWVSG